MPKKILLVEDDQFLHQLYKDLLVSEGYDVTSSRDGKDAFAQITSGTKWDLVLLDVVLPHMDGFAILQKCKDLKIRSEWLTVYMTNLEETATDDLKLKMADAVWVKSNMSPDEFLANVHSILTT